MSKPPQTLNPQSVQTRLTHLLKHWPTDRVRPATVSVHTYLQSRLAQVSDGPAKQPQQQLQQQQKPQNVEISEASLNALSSLLEDRYARRYPLPSKLRRPASNPDYYDNLIREFDEAPDRDLWGRLGKRLKGLFRFT